MAEKAVTGAAPEWATSSGDAWAERWPDIDRALAGLADVLNDAIAEAAPLRPLRAFDIGCGAGSTSLALAGTRPDASLVACDLSPALVRVAQQRLAGCSAQIVLGDAEEVAVRGGHFDLIYSRHGVMFFAEPVKAFLAFRTSANPGAKLVFSCFQDWDSNPWACELASAAAGRDLPRPGREPSGFAFAEPHYVREILSSAGWTDIEWRAVPFRYVAAGGDGAIEDALAFLGEIGPASRAVRDLPEHERGAAAERMRGVIERHFNGQAVEFAAIAWIYSARARQPPAA